MFGFDVDDLFQFGLIEVFASVLQDILGLLLQNLVQEHGDHILQLGMLAQVGLVVDPILHLLLIQQSHLGGSEPLDPSDVVRVVVLLLVVHVRDLVVIDLVLLVLLTHELCFKYYTENPKQHKG